MGYIVDVIGRPYCFVIFIFIVGIGQSVFSLSAHSGINSYWLAIVGRFLFGAVGKSVGGTFNLKPIVAQSSYISDWFKNRELALALGMTMCIGRCGSVLNFVIADKVYRSTHSMAFSFWLGTFMIGLSLLAGIVSVLLDQSIEYNSNYITSKEKTSKISLRELKNFTGKFWLVVFSLVGYYLGFLCFVNISVKFAIEKFGFDDDTAGLVAVSFSDYSSLYCT
jgi:MFS family permease